ncbi:hypothetical protein TYRP_008805 [Tyrophagus putrescentiae]|nr:hypothetical protein TYRP_008805 [Tyrophagus putrescentiae]
MSFGGSGGGDDDDDVGLIQSKLVLSSSLSRTLYLAKRERARKQTIEQEEEDAPRTFQTSLNQDRAGDRPERRSEESPTTTSSQFV